MFDFTYTWSGRIVILSHRIHVIQCINLLFLLTVQYMVPFWPRQFQGGEVGG